MKAGEMFHLKLTMEKKKKAERNMQKWEICQVLHTPILLFPQPSLSLMQQKSPIIQPGAQTKQSQSCTGSLSVTDLLGQCKDVFIKKSSDLKIALREVPYRCPPNSHRHHLQDET